MGRRGEIQRKSLYAGGKPIKDFNKIVISWLEGSAVVREHAPPKAFDVMRTACDLEVQNLIAAYPDADEWHALRRLLSDLTTLMFGDDISGRLGASLSGEHINPAGFRSALSLDPPT